MNTVDKIEVGDLIIEDTSGKMHVGLIYSEFNEYGDLRMFNVLYPTEDRQKFYQLYEGMLLKDLEYGIIKINKRKKNETNTI